MTGTVQGTCSELPLVLLMSLRGGHDYPVRCGWSQAHTWSTPCVSELSRDGKILKGREAGKEVIGQKRRNDGHA